MQGTLNKHNDSTNKPLDILLNGKTISGIADFFGINNKNDQEVINKILKIKLTKGGKHIFVPHNKDPNSYLIEKGSQRSESIIKYAQATYPKVLEKLKLPANYKSVEEFIGFLNQLEFKCLNEQTIEEITKKVRSALYKRDYLNLAYTLNLKCLDEQIIQEITKEITKKITKKITKEIKPALYEA